MMLRRFALRLAQVALGPVVFDLLVMAERHRARLRLLRDPEERRAL